MSEPEKPKKPSLGRRIAERLEGFAHSLEQGEEPKAIKVVRLDDGEYVTTKSERYAVPLNREQIEAFFLNHDEPVYELIQEAEDEETAEGVATHALRGAEQRYGAENLVAVVRKIRSA